MKTKLLLFAFSSLFFLSSCSNNQEDYITIDEQKAALGKEIFNDKNLSNPIGQACATCHSPEKGFSDISNSPISEGAITGIFGNRNAPSLSYNVFSPSRYYDTVDGTYVGGLFLDGRSPNLQEQAVHPMLNPLEMNNASVADIVVKIKNASYYSTIKSIYGEGSSDNQIMNYVADALMTFETSSEVNPYTSKYDYYLKGRATLSLEEKKGLALFQGKAMCAECHITDPDPIQRKVLFTDFTYDNIGVPKNTTNPFYNQTANSLGANYIDLGIGAIVNQPAHNGKFRVPTLRNIEISGPYFHNGSMATLEEVVHFYNKRDMNTGEFGPPETSQNLNITELGNLNLTDEEEQNVVAFLKTLTDGYHK